jgi:hypothetical protein
MNVNVRSLYKEGSLKTAASESATCNLYVMAVHEVRCEPAVGYTFFY